MVGNKSGLKLFFHCHRDLFLQSSYLLTTSVRAEAGPETPVFLLELKTIVLICIADWLNGCFDSLLKRQ